MGATPRADTLSSSSLLLQTTNQAFQEMSAIKNVIGLANQGISARLARQMHATQGISKLTLKSAI